MPFLLQFITIFIGGIERQLDLILKAALTFYLTEAANQVEINSLATREPLYS